MFGIPKLYAMIGIGVAVALFLAWVWRVDSLRARHLKDYRASELRHKVTTASLNQCLGQIADNNRRVADANKRLETDRQLAAADLARANARWEASAARVGGLEAAARATGRAPCTLSSEARTALEGL